ncbi:MAG: hypothetical protein D6681_21610 [Calditrichaeota bacterium]|nr:MAG: hypothetical protein D6681_21610 [Calditrichota bacterium]
MGTEVIVALIGVASGIIAALIGYIKSGKDRQAELERMREELRTEHQNALERMEAEVIQKLQGSMYQEQVEAHKKVWEILHLAAYAAQDEKTVIVRRADGVFLNRRVARTIFDRFQDLFYSELGMFIARPTREAIFKVRDYIFGILDENETQDGELVKIANAKAKKIENGFDWVRKNIRRDVGLDDLKIPKDKG